MMKKKILSYFCVALLSMSICGGVKADTTKSIELMDWNTGSLDSSLESVTQELPNDPTYYENFCDTFFKENEDQIAGASVAVIKDGKIIFEKGYGYSNIEKKIASNPSETIYEYGSVTKLFSWVSLMQLREQGKLNLEDSVQQYLDKDFKLPKKFDKDIRIIDLMNHQAGFDDYMIHLFSKQEDLVSLREALQENKVSQVAEPGFAISYSNYGAGLAGYLVELIAKQKNDEYIKENLFEKCNMDSTFMNPDQTKNKELWDRKATNYKVSDNGFKEGFATQVPMYPAGSGNGTIEDLAQFAIAMLDIENHPLFEKKETQLEMLSTSYQPFPGIAGVAHGFFEYEGCAPVFWHNGETAYAGSFFAIAPKANFGIVICTNCENQSIIQKLGMQMIRKSQKQINSEVAMAEESGQQYVDLSGKLGGYYLDFRESHKGIQKIIGWVRHLAPIHIKEVDEKHIEVSGTTYVRIGDYMYEDTITGTRMGITVEDGKVIKFTEIIDYIKMPTGKVVIAWVELVGILMTLLMALIQIIRFLVLTIRKKLTKVEYLMTAIVGGEILIGASIGETAIKLFQGDTLNAIRPFLIGNIVLEVAIAYEDITLMISQYKDKNKSKWIICFAIITAILLGIGIHLGFFSGC